MVRIRHREREFERKKCFNVLDWLVPLLLMLRPCRCVSFFRLADVGILCLAVACNVSFVSCLHVLKRLVQTSG